MAQGQGVFLSLFNIGMGRDTIGSMFENYSRNNKLRFPPLREVALIFATSAAVAESISESLLREHAYRSIYFVWILGGIGSLVALFMRMRRSEDEI